ncbi:MAG: TonB-dependent receptor [Gemmatimonadetes bacterium]|nr:TonB-dependent receptor [Gemmatimonadota bacterium]
MKFRNHGWALAAALVTSSSAGLAQQAPAASDSLPAYVLEGLTVLSTRAPAARLAVPQQIAVVTGSDLERTVTSELADALKKNESIDVIQYPGLLSAVSIRGFRPQFSGINQRTLLLVDGRPAGATNLSTLDAAAVERIEVLRGPASALYGSNAMGGVVNIITRRSSGAPHGSLSARYGSFESYRADLTAGGTLVGPLDFDLSLSAAGRNDGFRTGNRRTLGGGSLEKTLFNGRTVQVAEITRDTTLELTRFATRAGSLRVGYTLGQRWTAYARGELFRGDEVQNPGDINSAFPFPTLNDLERRSGEIGIAGELGVHAVTLRGYGADETTSYYNDARNPTFTSFRSPTRWYGAQLQNVARLGAHSLTAGVDYTAAEQRSESFRAADTPRAPFSPNSATYSAAAFTEAKLTLFEDRLVATAGARLDHVTFSVKETELLTSSRPGSDTHTVVNPSAGLLYRSPTGARFHAATGRAFVTPNAFNVAANVESRIGSRRAVTLTRGNPELDPENSWSWDAGVGLARPNAGIELDLTYFHTDVRDRIVTRLAPAAGLQLTPAGDTIVSVTSYANVDRAAIRGLEGRASYDIGAAGGFRYSLRLFGNATRILRAEEVAGEIETEIKNVAPLTAVFGAEFDDLHRFTARISGRYVGERFDTDFSDFSNVGDLHYPDFLVFDVTTSLKVAERYRVGVLLGNLLDENYYEVRGYNLPGRSVQVQLSVGI